jgi:hypothetical protein
MVSSKYHLSYQFLIACYKEIAQLSERNNWEKIIELLPNIIITNGKIEVKDIPTTNISTKNQHDITQFAIKAIKESNDSKKKELIELTSLSKDINMKKTMERIQAKEKELEILKKSEIELGNHLESLKKEIG